MDIAWVPTEVQRMLRDSARRWVDGIRPDEARAQWDQIVDMGWLLAALPEDNGGLGGTLDDAAVVAEELGRGLVRAPFVDIGVAAAQLLLALAPERVAAIGTGEARPLVAHDELEARGDPAWIGTRARLVDGRWWLRGRKTGLVGMDVADRLLVSAIAEGYGPTLFELPVEDATLKRFRTIDDRAGAELILADTPAVPIGIVGGALPALEHSTDCALVLEGAEALGAMDKVLALTREYLLTRKQFGRPIGDFQVLRHRLADMFIEIEQTRSMVLRGLAALRAGPKERARFAAATKACAAEAAAFVGAQGIQLHGGIGMTVEYPVGHFFKRLNAFNLRHGSGAVHVERFAALSLPEQQPA